MDLQKQILTLDWFNDDEGLFWVAMGIDGTPFGKGDSMIVLLVG